MNPATRSSVRSELAELLQSLNLTTMIVTHDREEAFELADRIAVLVDGRIQQHSKPEEAYERPVNLTVARFMGANVLSVRARSDRSAELNDDSRQPLELPRPAREGPAHVVIVPEQVRLAQNHLVIKNVLRGDLMRCQYRGGEYRLRVRVGNSRNGQVIEARSKDAPQEEHIFIQLPVESLHVIEEAPLADAKTELQQPIGNVELTKLEEKIA